MTSPEGTDEAVEAAARAVQAHLSARTGITRIPLMKQHAIRVEAKVALTAAAPYVAVQERQDIIRELEQADSALCDCRHGDSSVPISPKTGAAMDHHCDCRAVAAASILLGANSLTRHAQECGHGTVFDEFYTPLAAWAAGKDQTDG